MLFLPPQTCKPFRKRALGALIHLWMLLIFRKSKTFFITKTRILVYKWFPWHKYFPNTHSSDPWQILLAFSAGLKSILLHSFLFLEIFLLTFMKDLGVWVSKELEYEFSYVGHDCSSGPFGWEGTLSIFIQLCLSVNSCKWVVWRPPSPKSPLPRESEGVYE